MNRYICKRCGAESPMGIGYAHTGEGPLPAPDPACPNPHAWECTEDLCACDLPIAYALA